MAYLEIIGLGKRFGGADVLHDVDLTLEKGQILSLIGPSGEGKTTFLRCLNFLETPDCGIIRLNGETLFNAAQVRTKAKPSRRAFGLVFQAFHLFPQYTVLENVTLAPTLAKKGTPAELREKALSVPGAIASCIPLSLEDATTLARILRTMMADFRKDVD